MALEENIMSGDCVDSDGCVSENLKIHEHHNDCSQSIDSCNISEAGEKEKYFLPPKILPLRKTRGKRKQALIGMEAEADDEFWGHKTWTEDPGDEEWFTENESEYEDFIDSDFLDSVSETDDSENTYEQALLDKEEKEEKRKKKKTVYKDPREFRKVKRNCDQNTSSQEVGDSKTKRPSRPFLPMASVLHCEENPKNSRGDQSVKRKHLTQEEHLKLTKEHERQNLKRLSERLDLEKWRKSLVQNDESLLSPWKGKMELLISWASNRTIETEKTSTVIREEPKPYCREMLFFVDYDNPINSCIPTLYKAEAEYQSNGTLQNCAAYAESRAKYRDPQTMECFSNRAAFLNVRKKYDSKGSALLKKEFRSMEKKIRILLKYFNKHNMYPFDLVSGKRAESSVSKVSSDEVAQTKEILLSTKTSQVDPEVFNENLAKTKSPVTEVFKEEKEEEAVPEEKHDVNKLNQTQHQIVHSPHVTAKYDQTSNVTLKQSSNTFLENPSEYSIELPSVPKNKEEKICSVEQSLVNGKTESKHIINNEQRLKLKKIEKGESFSFSAHCNAAPKFEIIDLPIDIVKNEKEKPDNKWVTKKQTTRQPLRIRSSCFRQAFTLNNGPNHSSNHISEKYGITPSLRNPHYYRNAYSLVEQPSGSGSILYNMVPESNLKMNPTQHIPNVSDQPIPDVVYLAPPDSETESTFQPYDGSSFLDGTILNPPPENMDLYNGFQYYSPSSVAPFAQADEHSHIDPRKVAGFRRGKTKFLNGAFSSNTTDVHFTDPAFGYYNAENVMKYDHSHYNDLLANQCDGYSTQSSSFKAQSSMSNLGSTSLLPEPAARKSFENSNLPFSDSNSNFSHQDEEKTFLHPSANSIIFTQPWSSEKNEDRTYNCSLLFRGQVPNFNSPDTDKSNVETRGGNPFLETSNIDRSTAT